MFTLNYKVVREGGKINPPAYKGDAGYDVFATEDIILYPQDRFKMPLGISLEFPSGYVCQVNQKSGVSDKLGIDTIGNIVDSNYRGELHAILVNTSRQTISITKGMKIAQLVFISIVNPVLYEVGELSYSPRDIKGFGSSGK